MLLLFVCMYVCLTKFCPFAADSLKPIDFMLAYEYVALNKRTCIHTYIHTYIDTFIHTYSDAYILSTVYRVNTRVNVHIPAERGSVLRFLVQGDGSRGQDRNVAPARDHYLGRVTPDIPGAGIRVW